MQWSLNPLNGSILTWPAKNHFRCCRGLHFLLILSITLDGWKWRETTRGAKFFLSSENLQSRHLSCLAHAGPKFPTVTPSFYSCIPSLLTWRSREPAFCVWGAKGKMLQKPENKEELLPQICYCSMSPTCWSPSK